MSELDIVIPASLQSYADGTFYETVRNFAQRTLSDFVNTMPDAQLYSRYNDAPATHAVVYRPDEFDSKHAVFVLNPFGNGHEPHMDIRHRLMQAVATPHAQVVAFPNNTAQKRYYSLTQQDLAIVAEGDATPLAESIHATAEEMGLESIYLITYSQGTFVGTALLRLAQQRGVIQIDKALIAEPTNVIDRTPAELKRAFMKTGLSPLIRAVRDSGIPALTEAQAMRGPRDWLRLGRGLLGVHSGSKIPENNALHAGMTHRNITRIMGEILAKDFAIDGSHSLRTAITVARAEKSKVTPANSIYKILTAYARDSVEIEGYGHEAADNVSGVFALLSKMALR